MEEDCIGYIEPNVFHDPTAWSPERKALAEKIHAHFDLPEIGIAWILGGYKHEEIVSDELKIAWADCDSLTFYPLWATTREYPASIENWEDRKKFDFGVWIPQETWGGSEERFTAALARECFQVEMRRTNRFVTNAFTTVEGAFECLAGEGDPFWKEVDLDSELPTLWSRALIARQVTEEICGALNWKKHVQEVLKEHPERTDHYQRLNGQETIRPTFRTLVGDLERFKEKYREQFVCASGRWPILDGILKLDFSRLSGLEK